MRKKNQLNFNASYTFRSNFWETDYQSVFIYASETNCKCLAIILMATNYFPRKNSLGPRTKFVLSFDRMFINNVFLYASRPGSLSLLTIFFKKTHQWLYISGFFSVISSAKNVLENLERLPQILVTDFDVIFVLELFDSSILSLSSLAGLG